MVKKYSYIPTRLKNAAENDYVAGAEDILDDALNKTQEEINAIVLTPSAGIDDRLRTIENGVRFEGTIQTEGDPANVVSQGEKVTTANAVRGAIDVRTGYFKCTTASGTAKKTASAPGYVLSRGGAMKIWMEHANTIDNATLDINSTGEKALFYNDDRAGSKNSWEDGEVISVYYDETANSNAGAYFATNAQGGGGFVKDGSMGIDLDITDDSEHVLARFSNGHVMTKNFDSSKVNIETGDDLSADLDIEDENGRVLVRFSGGHIMTKYFDSASKAERPSSGYEVFSYMVDTTIPTRRTSGTTVQDGENLQADKGIVMLPESYTSNGNPTRLVMFAHGLGGLITSSSTSFSQSFPLHSALLADGYAIFEINGTPGVENTSYSHFGGPVWVRSCIAAYKYLISKYNFRTDGILTYGYSLGGLGTLQLPNFNLPVIAQVTYAGVYDQFKSSYSKDTAAGKADFLARFGMTDYSFTLTNGGNNVVPPQQEREYIIEHRDMWARYADLAYGVTTPDIARMYSVWPAPSTTQDADEEAIYDGLVINNRPPCLFIQGEADTTIVKRYTTYLATMIGNSGKVADVRFFTGGTHQNILTIGDNVSYTAANGQTLTLNASSYEGLLFLKRFNH